MIKIKKTQNNFERKGEQVIVFSPERELTSEESLTITSVVCNGLEYIYYQGDEPVKEIVEDTATQVDLPLTDEQLKNAFLRLKELGVI